MESVEVTDRRVAGYVATPRASTATTSMSWRIISVTRSPS